MHAQLSKTHKVYYRNGMHEIYNMLGTTSEHCVPIHVVNDSPIVYELHPLTGALNRLLEKLESGPQPDKIQNY